MISAALVKDLREKTGAGMMDCKKALVEVGGDFDAAVDWLRTKGLSAAAKKADRIAAEGLIGIAVSGNNAAIVEVNAETDFVARNTQFQNLVSGIASKALECNSLDALKAASMDSSNVADQIIEAVAKIGENITLRRTENVKVNNGVVASYVHNSVADNLGKIGVLVALESASVDKEALLMLGKQIAMHIAATKPQSLSVADLDQSLVEHERVIFAEQSKASGKPDNIIEKMVEGRIRKFYEEVVLLEQIFVIDGKTKISDVLQELSKKLGSPVSITSFVRYEIGEGIEQEEKNFADEVAAVLK